MTEENGLRSTALSDFIWKNAEDLWGDFKHAEFGKIILPFTLLRRLECVLEPTRGAVAKAIEAHEKSGIDLDLILRQVAGYPFYNTSKYSLGRRHRCRPGTTLPKHIHRPFRNEAPEPQPMQPAPSCRAVAKTSTPLAFRSLPLRWRRARATVARLESGDIRTSSTAVVG